MNIAAHVIFMLVAVMGLCHSVTCLIHLCPPGTFLWTPRSGPEVCLRCTEGVNFMPLSGHSLRSCFDCTKMQDTALEILVTECNRTHDAVILCRPGYFRRMARNSRQTDFCQKCDECEYPILPCHDVYDTVCCPSPNYEAVLSQDGTGMHVCKELPILCQPGQYFDTSTEQCRPCPSGTYMTDMNHTNTACNICQTVPDSQSHQVILQACNSTHPTIIGCQHGYFSDRELEQTGGEVTCLPCSKCPHGEQRLCQMFHDTVCSNDINRIMVDTDDVLKLRHQVKNYANQTAKMTGLREDVLYQTVCGEDQHLSTNPSDRTATCLSCKPGSYLDKFSHTLTACKNCTEFMGEHRPVPCQHNTDRCARTSQGYRWSLVITTLLPAIIIVIIMCWKPRVSWKLQLGGCEIKTQELLSAHLEIVCLMLVATTFSPDDPCLWSVVIVALLYVLVTIANKVHFSRHLRQCMCVSGDKTAADITSNEPPENQSLISFKNHRDRLDNQHGDQEIITVEISHHGHEMDSDSEQSSTASEISHHGHEMDSDSEQSSTASGDYSKDTVDLARQKREKQGNYSKDTVDLARQKREKQGKWLAEISYGGELDFHRHLEACDKNPGHQNFIPVDQFNVEHLPSGYDDNDLVDLVRAVSDLTVRVSVKYVSDRRPETVPGSDKPYPCYSNRERDIVRAGTGWINSVRKFPNEYDSDSVCKCKECVNSPTPNKQFACIFITTSAHVIYDQLEAENTTCHLFFDRGGTPDRCSGVVTLNGMSEVRSNSELDFCVMSYYTHDLDLAGKVDNMVYCLASMDENIYNKYNNPKHLQRYNSETSGDDLMPTIIVSHPHGCSKQVSLGQWSVMKERVGDGYEYTYTTARCPGSSGAPVCKLGSRNYSVYWLDTHYGIGNSITVLPTYLTVF